MGIYVQAFREAVKARNLLKTMAKGKVAEYCKERGLQTDVFETAANKVKETSGEYTKNWFKKIHRFFKEFVANLKSAKKVKSAERIVKQNTNMAEFLERTAKRPSMENFIEEAGQVDSKAIDAAQ